MSRTRHLMNSLSACGIGLLALISGNAPSGWARNWEVANRSEFLKAVDQARPGDQILLASGEWQGGLLVRNLAGEEGKPILLGALDPARPPHFLGGSSALQLVQPRHIIVQDWVIRGASGNGLNIDDGGGGAGEARHITLRRLRVQDIGPRGNHDGLKLSGVEHFRIEDCHLERWGDGGSGIDLVGCHDGAILGCRFKHQGTNSGNGVQAKGGSARVQIRGCLFDHAGGRGVNLGGSTGRDYFRPRGANHEARELTVEDCVFMGSLAPVAFVGVDGAVVRHNTFYRPEKWVMRILQESRDPLFVPCRNGSFENNLIVFRSSEVQVLVNVGSGTLPDSFRFSGNHWFCEDRPERSQPRGLPTTESHGTHGVNPRLRNPAALDVRISPGALGREVGARSAVWKE